MDAQETRIYTAAIITVIIFGGIVLYFIISMVLQQRKKFKLNRHIIRREITEIEKERTRIAYDLHDELGPILSYIKLKINVFELTDADDKIQIEKVNDNIDKALIRIREISYNLMPAVLLNAGLANALQDYANNIKKDILDINFTFHDNIFFDEQASINIYRIVQEIIHNTIRHSGATRLDIIFKSEKNKINISLKDNGIGFDVNNILHKTGLGFKSLHSRAQLMNGKMFIVSKVGIGTEFIFEIPN